MAVAVVPMAHYYALGSTSDLRCFYLGLGVVVAAVIWYRLRRQHR
ncbi:hypothetical protein ACTWJ8_33840 [Streptomyces sp. SDT5-1]